MTFSGIGQAMSALPTQIVVPVPSTATMYSPLRILDRPRLAAKFTLRLVERHHAERVVRPVPAPHVRLSFAQGQRALHVATSINHDPPVERAGDLDHQHRSSRHLPLGDALAQREHGPRDSAGDIMDTGLVQVVRAALHAAVDEDGHVSIG